MIFAVVNGDQGRQLFGLLVQVVAAEGGTVPTLLLPLAGPGTLNVRTFYWIDFVQV